jgi:hypothetical protein
MKKTPREYYKERHPNLFSDSKAEATFEYDREVLDHALASITKNNKEQAFEKFCFRVCEKRICANLIPNTGPAGGGDGKVDADTFPIADSVMPIIYEGVGRNATQERWAFAFSAKQRWKQKLKHDIESIKSTNRPYTNIVFVTNQSIPSKERQSEQDKYAQCNVSVTIFDRSWLLDSIIFHECADYAAEELGLSSATKVSEKAGPRDKRRSERLSELLTSISSDIKDSSITYLTADNLLSAAKLSRMLEKPQLEVEKIFEEALTYSNASGTDEQQLEIKYQFAWTLFWWYEDYDGFLKAYNSFISIALESTTYEGLSKWKNLWQITPVAIEQLDVKKNVRKTKQFLDAIDNLLTQTATGSTTELNLKILKIQTEVSNQLAKGSVKASHFKSLRGLAELGSHHMAFDFNAVVAWVEFVSEILPQNEDFESLFDLVTDIRAKREGEVTAAKMLLDRAASLIQSKDSKYAILRLTRAHSHLLKHETRSECMFCLAQLGRHYLQVGLVWAARSAFVSVASIGFQYLDSEKEVHPGLKLSLIYLRKCATALGLLGESLAWHELYRMVLGIDYQTTGRAPNLDEDETNFEILLSRLILRIPTDERQDLGGLPAILDEVDLPIAADFARVKLGAELSVLDYMPTAPDKSVLDSIYHMRADIGLPEKPNDIPPEPTKLSTLLFGCKFLIEFHDAENSRAIAEVILSLIEPIFATATVGEAYATQEVIRVKLESVESMDQEVSIDRLDADPEIDFLIQHGGRVSESLRSNPNFVSRNLIECALLIGFGSIKSESFLANLDKSSDNSLFSQSQSVCQLTSQLRYLFGNDMEALDMSKRLVRASEVCEVKSEMWQPGQSDETNANNETKEVAQQIDEAVILKKKDDLSHSDISVVSPIRMAVWDAAGWFGVFFAWSPYEQVPPIMALGFDNIESGRAIFEGWKRSYVADFDKRIRVSIIRGISKANPCHYRVVISGYMPENKSGAMQFYQAIARIHTLEATSPDNLEGFLAMFSHHKQYFFGPAGRSSESSEDLNRIVQNGFVMKSLVVRNAWEIGPHDPDMVGVQDSDDVIIPDSSDDPPVSKLREWRRNLHEHEDGIGE